MSLLNCHSDEIAIVTSATEAWQQVVYGLAWSWQPGDCLLTSFSEYGSNYIAYLQLRKRTYIEIIAIPETDNGDLCLDSLQRILLASTKKHVLISLNHVPTSSGKVYNVQGVGALASRYRVPFLLDACQSVGHLPVDVQSIQCDFLSGTGRKYLRGPRGAGFLFCRRESLGLLEPGTLDNTGATWVAADAYEMRPTARRFERYEMSFASKVGLGIAVEECLHIGIENIWERIQCLAQYLRQGLASVPGVQVMDRGEHLCGIVTFVKQGLDPAEIQSKLMIQKGINTSVSSAASSRLDFDARELTAVVRGSVHIYNTKEEIDSLIEFVRHI